MPEFLGIITTTILCFAAGWNDLRTMLRTERYMNEALEQAPDAQWNRYGFRERHTISREFLARGGDRQIEYAFRRSMRRLQVILAIWLGANIVTFLVIRNIKQFIAA